MNTLPLTRRTLHTLSTTVTSSLCRNILCLPFLKVEQGNSGSRSRSFRVQPTATALGSCPTKQRSFARAPLFSRHLLRRFGLGTSRAISASPNSTSASSQDTEDEAEATTFSSSIPLRTMADRTGFQLVIAATPSGGIGKDGKLPDWKLPGDMAYFKQLTSNTHKAHRRNAVIMGRRTWESIPENFRPLKNRINIVLSRSFDDVKDEKDADSSADQNSSAAANGGVVKSPAQHAHAICQSDSSVSEAEKTKAKISTSSAASAYEVARSNGARLGQDVLGCGSLNAALALLREDEALKAQVESIFIIGGGEVYKQALSHPDCIAVHLTQVEQEYECDTFLPPLDPAVFRVWSSSEPFVENGTRYSFVCYTRCDLADPPQLPPSMASRHDELQYLELVEELITKGTFRPDRTGTGTFSRFGRTARYNLRHTFPLLTSKRVFWKGVAEELLWFISGSTNANLLRDKNIHIWDGNSTREFLDGRGLHHREVGDLGPVYGFQWRHFGAAYKDMHADYTGQGVDQLRMIIDQLRKDPNDRRMILSAWNPAVLHEMALPPCHMFCQFYVADGELSCLMYQRSCDVGLGVPFNIASYALLTRLVAQVTGLKPGELVHMMGDTHVYANHVEPLKEQLKNSPRHFPTLRINPAKTDIDSFVFEDLELVDYNPHKTIKMQMAV